MSRFELSKVLSRIPELLNMYNSEMEIDRHPSPADLAASTMAQGSRQTKTAWFDKIKEKMVNDQQRVRGRPTPTGEPVGYAWHQRLQSEHYGQPSQHVASSGGAVQPLEDVNMYQQEPGPSQERRRSSDGEDEGLEADIEDNVNDRGERGKGR